MAEIIFGIDHGNGNMKGENVCFPCGLVRYVSEPGRFMNEDILEYQGTYYTLSDTRMPFKADKTVDDDYFILTLYALAMEARNKGITLTGKDVVLGVGLPPADYGQQAASFKKYFLDHAKHGMGQIKVVLIFNEDDERQREAGEYLKTKKRCKTALVTELVQAWMKNGETGAGTSTGAMSIDAIKKQLLQDKEFLSEIEKSMGGTSCREVEETEPEVSDNLDMDEDMMLAGLSMFDSEI